VRVWSVKEKLTGVPGGTEGEEEMRRVERRVFSSRATMEEVREAVKDAEEDVRLTVEFTLEVARSCVAEKPASVHADDEEEEAGPKERSAPPIAV
jgi:hypothetical protein